MAAKKVGTLIREARMDADMTQEQLARRIAGLSADEISLAERGKLDLTQAQLKQIAKVTGVTQASLINAVRKPAATKRRTPASASTITSMKVSASEKRLVELYRDADTETKREVVKLLKGQDDIVDLLVDDVLDNVLDAVQDLLIGR